MLTCSFCNQSEQAAAKLIQASDHHICDSCVFDSARIVLGDYCNNEKLHEVSPKEYCQFCDKIPEKIWKLIEVNSGPRICDYCLELCCDILETEGIAKDAEGLRKRIVRTRPKKYVGKLKFIFSLFKGWEG